MKYKVIFICYLERNGAQRQKAFISKATDNARILYDKYGIKKEIHMLLVDIDFFKSKKEAIKAAETYCRPEEIYQ